MIDCDNIILGQLARVGDRVFYNVKRSSDRYRETSAMNGKLGVVFAFHLYEQYVPRFGGGSRKPGVYQRKGATIVRWDDGTGGVVSEHDLAWWPWPEQPPAGTSMAMAAEAIKAHNEAMMKDRQAQRNLDSEFESDSIYLRELPELEYYEGDIVKVKAGQLQRVRAINWHYYGERRHDGSFMPLLDLTPADGGGGSSSYGLGEVSLVSRGNVWKWFHGDAAGMSFGTVEEEAGFYSGLGRCHEIKSPAGHYSFTLDEAVAAVRSGEGDAIGVGGGLFGSRRTTHVWKYHDAGPAARIREATLKGFAEVGDSRGVNA